jgi:hypothetical protein
MLHVIMQPFAAILGFIAGSLVAIAFGLAVVLMVFWLLRAEHPQFRAELPELARSFVIFFCLAAFAALAFLGTVRSRRWRYAPLAFMWVGLSLTAWYYWPS